MHPPKSKLFLTRSPLICLWQSHIPVFTACIPLNTDFSDRIAFRKSVLKKFTLTTCHMIFKLIENAFSYLSRYQSGAAGSLQLLKSSFCSPFKDVSFCGTMVPLSKSLMVQKPFWAASQSSRMRFGTIYGLQPLTLWGATRGWGAKERGHWTPTSLYTPLCQYTPYIYLPANFTICSQAPF